MRPAYTSVANRQLAVAMLLMVAWSPGCSSGSRQGDSGVADPNSGAGTGGTGGDGNPSGQTQPGTPGTPGTPGAPGAPGTPDTGPGTVSNSNTAANPNVTAVQPAQTTQTIGRFIAATSGQTFVWTGSTMMATFTGTGISLSLNELTQPIEWPGDPKDAQGKPTTQGNRYAVTVDGKTTTLLPTLGAGTYPLAQNIAAGTHTVKVVKVTEARVGSATFGGFTVVGGQLVAVSRTILRRLEIIGDSISAGYGDLGDSSSCSYSPATQDGSQAYGMLAAAAVNADVHVIAYSGKGVYRNNSSAKDAIKDAIGNMTMSQLWTTALPDDPQAAWTTASWLPDAVVINLGTNDFYQSTPPKAAFEAALLALVKQVRAAYSAATILLVLGPMLSDYVATQPNQLTNARTYIQDVVASASDAKVHFVEFTLPDDTYLQGCDGHPTVAAQGLMAMQLQTALTKYLGW